MTPYIKAIHRKSTSFPVLVLEAQVQKLFTNDPAQTLN